MPDFTICDLCQTPGHLETASDINKIASNLRQFQDQKFTVWRCKNCHSLHSKESVDLEFYYRHYITLPNGYALACAYQNRLNCLIKQGLTPEKTLLDFGCNQGFFVNFLMQAGYEKVTGYDAYIPAFSDPRPLASQYDFVISYDVIEHIDSPKACLEKLVSCLKPGGVLVLGTPDASGITLSDRDRTSLHQPYHRHILSKQALLNLGNQYGLELIQYSNRSFYDTWIPGVNSRAIAYYIQKTGNLLDVVTEPPRFFTILTSPLLIFYVFLGYLFPPSNQMTIFFTKKS